MLGFLPSDAQLNTNEIFPLGPSGAELPVKMKKVLRENCRVHLEVSMS